MIRELRRLGYQVELLRTPLRQSSMSGKDFRLWFEELTARVPVP